MDPKDKLSIKRNDLAKEIFLNNDNIEGLIIKERKRRISK